MIKVFKNNYFYGKEKNRTNFIKKFVLENKDKKILILDLEENVNKLYPISLLNTVDGLVLNSEVSTMIYALDMIDERNVDILIINGCQNINNYEENNKNDFLEEIEKIKIDKTYLSIFLGEKKTELFKVNKKIEKIKVKNFNEKVFKINKDLDLNSENILRTKRNLLRIINNKNF